MRIGIDISQLAYEKTGVATYLKNLLLEMIRQDRGNEYILFYSSLRKKLPDSELWRNGSTGLRINTDTFPTHAKSIIIKEMKFPPTFLDLLWNKLHIFPIEKFIGPVDVFISSDWTQPPSKAKKVTILYDMIVYKYPEETHNQTTFSFKNFLVSPNIVVSQKRRLKWVKKEVDKILCISEATKKDAMDILRVEEKRLIVAYPGVR